MYLSPNTEFINNHKRKQHRTVHRHSPWPQNSLKSSEFHMASSIWLLTPHLMKKTQILTEGHGHFDQPGTLPPAQARASAVGAVPTLPLQPCLCPPCQNDCHPSIPEPAWQLAAPGTSQHCCAGTFLLCSVVIAFCLSLLTGASPAEQTTETGKVPYLH